VVSSTHKTCPVCGGDFVRQHNRQRYCSAACRIKQNNRDSYSRHKAERNAESRAYYAAHRAEQRDKGRLWYQNNREASLASRKERHLAHRDEELSYYRAWRAAHREEANAKGREYHYRNRDYANSQRRAYRAANYETEIASQRRSYRISREKFAGESLLRGAQSRAKKKNLPYDLTKEWLLSRWTGRCELSGIPFVLRDGAPGPKFYSPSIDRIVPALGYVQSNCRVILWAVNALKHDGTDEDMYRVARALADTL